MHGPKPASYRCVTRVALVQQAIFSPSWPDPRRGSLLIEDAPECGLLETVTSAIWKIMLAAVCDLAPICPNLLSPARARPLRAEPCLWSAWWRRRSRPFNRDRSAGGVTERRDGRVQPASRASPACRGGPSLLEGLAHVCGKDAVEVFGQRGPLGMLTLRLSFCPDSSGVS